MSTTQHWSWTRRRTVAALGAPCVRFLPNDLTLTITPIVNGYRHIYRNIQGRYHRLDGPAIIDYENDQITREEYYQNDQSHKLDGPAKIRYENGQITHEAYYRNNRPHRLDNPAVINYENGQITSEAYHQNGRLHRLDGPAIIFYENGRITREWYYQSGRVIKATNYGLMSE